MTVTVIALLSINEDEPMALAEYFRVTQPLLERAGAKIVKRFLVNQAVIGPEPAKTVVLVEYPDMEAVNSVFESPEYQSVIPFRDRAFHFYNITVGADAETSEPRLAADDRG